MHASAGGGRGRSVRAENSVEPQQSDERVGNGRTAISVQFSSIRSVHTLTRPPRRYPARLARTPQHKSQHTHWSQRPSQHTQSHLHSVTFGEREETTGRQCPGTRTLGTRYGYCTVPGVLALCQTFSKKKLKVAGVSRKVNILRKLRSRQARLRSELINYMHVIFQKRDGYWDRAATRDNTSGPSRASAYGPGTDARLLMRGVGRWWGWGVGQAVYM